MAIHRSPLVYSAYEAAGGQAIAAGPTAVTFDTEQFTLPGLITFSGGNTWTVSAQGSGLWLCSFYVNWKIAGGRTSYEVFWSLNGSEYPGSRPGNYTRSEASASAPAIPIQLAATNTLQVIAVRTSGGSGAVVRPNGARITLLRVE